MDKPIIVEATHPIGATPRIHGRTRSSRSRPATGTGAATPAPNTGTLTPGRERTVIRHLPFFITLAEEGSFRRAAEQLGLSQPALTRRIQALELELGLSLFSRVGRSVSLTEAGRTLLEETQQILADVRSGVRRAQQVSRGEGGEIRVAVNEHALRSGVVVKCLHDFRSKSPCVEVRMLMLTTEAQVRALRSGEIDLGLLYDVALDPKSREEVEMLKVCESRALLCINENHPLAHKPQICVADLGDEGLTWPSREHGRSVHDARIAAFRAAGVSPNIALEVMSDETTINIAAANLGMGFVLEGQRLPDNVLLRQIEDLPTLSLSLHAVWRKNSVQPALDSLVGTLRTMVEDVPQSGDWTSCY